MKEEYLSHLINDLSRLQWACRRGMLELDILLGSFLKKVYPSLSKEYKQQFIKLLNYPDPELIDWLMGRSVPKDPEIVMITDEIRQHVQSGISLKAL